MTDAVLNALSALPEEWVVLIIAAMPIIELRGAIPVGVAMGLPTLEVFALAILGNLLPVPIILLLLGPIRRWANQWPVVGPVLRWAEERAWKRREQVEKYGFWGLVAFVGIPLPGTGAWTGSLIAVLLEIRFWPALLANVVGVLLAGVLIAILSVLGLGAVQMF